MRLLGVRILGDKDLESRLYKLKLMVIFLFGEDVEKRLLFCWHVDIYKVIIRKQVNGACL